MDFYRQSFGFSELVLTLIYAVYAVGNLGALLLFGRFSDEIGRRPVALTALALGGVSTLIFVFAAGTAWLFWARLVSGFAIGLASGTGAAWLAELDSGSDKSSATLTATSANFTGLAFGAVIAGGLSQYAPWPLRLTFVIYLVILGAVAFFIMRAQETVRRRAGSALEVSIRPRLGIPRELRLPFIAPAVTAFGTFALIGFYAAIVPGVLSEALHLTNRAIAGAVVFELFLVSIMVMIAIQRLESRIAMLSGLAMLLPSLALLVLAQALSSLALLLAGTALSGAAAAFGYRGSLQVVNEMAPEERRAEIVSSYYVCTFLGNSLPVIGVGIVATFATSLTASAVFAATIALFAIAAILAGVRYSSSRGSPSFT